MRNIIIILFVFGCQFSLHAQFNVDSLKKVVAGAFSDNNKIDAATRIAFTLANDNPDEAIRYGNIAKGLADKTNNDSLKAIIDLRIALAYDTKKEYFISRSLYHHSLDLAIKRKNISVQTKATNNLGLSYSLEGKLDSSLYWYQQSLNLSRQIKDTNSILRGINNVGTIYEIKKDNRQAIVFFKEALSLSEKINHIPYELIVLENLVICYNNLKKYDSSIQFAFKKLELSDSINDKREMLVSKTRIGETYLRMNELDKSLKYFDEIEKDIDAAKNTKTFPIVIGGKGEIFLYKKQYDKAIAYLNRALDLTIQANIIEQTRDEHFLLAKAYEEMGNFRLALEQFKKYKIYNDSLLNDENIKNVNELTARYESQQKEQEISLLNAANKLKDESLKAKNTEIFLYILLIIFGLTVISILYSANKNTQKNSKELLEKNKIITRTLNEKDILLKEIHHRVKNNLQVISSLLNLQSKTIKDKKSLEAIKEGRDRVKNMALIHQNLYQDENLTDVNMKEYIEKLVENLFKSYNIEKEKIKLVYNIDDVKLDLEMVIPVGLILNELISNSLKYAFNEKEQGILKVVLQQNEETLFLEVSDNGRGMPENWSIYQANSLGYQIIQAFVNKLKAEISIINYGGACVRINIKNQNNNV